MKHSKKQLSKFKSTLCQKVTFIIIIIQLQVDLGILCLPNHSQMVKAMGSIQLCTPMNVIMKVMC
jgi:hypothetical protein